MGYFVVKNEASESFEEKKSIFIGSIKRVYNEADAKSFIEEIKNKNPNSKHNVFAYLIGKNYEVQRYSDDGEPQGSAGIPALEVLKRTNITDTCIVVTRYFGGILLGKGGLARAYSKAAALACHKGEKAERVIAFPVFITIEYEMLGKVQYIFAKEDIQVENIEYGEKVKITVLTKVDDYGKVDSLVTECSSGKCQILKGKEEYYLEYDSKIHRDYIK